MSISAPPRPAPLGRSRRPRRRLGAAVLALVLLSTAGVVLALSLRDDPSSDARVATGLDSASLVPEIDPVDATALHPRRLVPAPRTGAVSRLAGPFDDSLRLDGLTMDSSAGTLTGTATVLDEVSELIVLELQAAWYDVDGLLLGTSRTALDHEDAEALEAAHDAGEGGAGHESGMPFTLTAPVELRDRAVSAQLYALVLVNE